MKIEEDNFNDGSASQNSIDPLENNIRYRLRKNPNKTKNLYVDELIEKKTKKKGENSSGLSEKGICRTILDIVKKDEKSFLFRQPAIRAFTNQKDKEYYKRTIKEPRDLGGITKKLKTPKYSPKEFYEDMELCWSNAQLFNENNTVVYHDAVYLKELCSKLYKEYGLFDIINKEKEIESNTNINSNDSNSINDKNKNENKDNKSNESRTKDKSENISINSNKTISNDTERYNNNDSSYSSELKNNKMIGKKRKRKKKEETKNIETTIKEDEDEVEDKDDNEKKLNNKKARKKRSKLAIDEVKEIPVAKTKKSKNKASFEDIKKKFPINFPVISDLNDINKISHKRKSISQNRGNNTRNLLSTNNSKNRNNSGNNYNKKKQAQKVQNSKNNFNINMIGENDKRRIAYEFIMDIFKSNFPVQNFENQKNNDKNIYETYEPERPKIESQELSKYDNNCNNENVHKMETKIQKKKQNNNSDLNKNNYSQNMNNINSNIHNSGRLMNSCINISDKIIDQKDEKKMQLRLEIAKYFDNLSDSNMIELLVYIENIRPQSIRILENDTIYINMEEFNEETFNKVFEFVKKFV